MAQRRADEALKAKVGQKPMDVGLFGDEKDQRELFQRSETIDTPEFARWSRGAPVVHSDEALTHGFKTGEPVVVESFHGTQADFEAFDKSKRGTAAGGPGGKMGDFSASNPAVASSYADTTNPYHEGIIGRLNRLTGNRYEKFNEGILRMLGRPSVLPEGANVKPIYVRLSNPLVYDFKGEPYRDRSYAEIIEQAKAEGHDGVVLKNTFDEGYTEGGNQPTNVYVSFEPEQIKLIFNRGTFDPNDPRILYQTGQQAPPFYSAVERAITESKQEKASPEQWLAMLKNRPGIKGSELDELALENWLKEQKGSVSKQDLADYVRANKIEVREVERGDLLAGDAPAQYVATVGQEGLNHLRTPRTLS